MLPRRVLMNDKIVSAQGENLSLVNVKGSKLNALLGYGKSTQDGTPNPENPVPIVSAGDDGEINVSVSDAGINILFNTGENKDYNTIHRNWRYGSQNYSKVIVTGNQAHYTVNETGIGANESTGFGCDFANLDDTDIIFKRGQKYVWSCDAKGISSPNQRLTMKVFYTNTSGSEWVSTGSKTVQLTEDWERYSCEFTVPDDFDEEANRIVLNFPIGTDTTAYLDIKNLKLEKGTVATKWTPNPTDGDPLNYQPLTLSTPGGLPGIPVSSGGNYTDESGQQWVCDEIDLKRGKYVQRVKKLSIDDFTIDPGVKPGTTGYRFAAITPDRTVLIKQPALCNYFPFDSTPFGSFNTEGNYIATDETGRVFIRVTDDITLDEFHQTYPDLVAYYILETPIETGLSDEEIAAYKALHTYSPTTTVSNDAEAWMKIGYREYRAISFGWYRKSG